MCQQKLVPKTKEKEMKDIILKAIKTIQKRIVQNSEVIWNSSENQWEKTSLEVSNISHSFWVFLR